VVGAAQLGPIARDDSHASAAQCMIAVMERTHARDHTFVVFAELALTTFFPRWYDDDQAEIDGFFEMEMPGRATRPLCDRARDPHMVYLLRIRRENR
jgi:predicted amidohydrolase